MSGIYFYANYFRISRRSCAVQCSAVCLNEWGNNCCCWLLQRGLLEAVFLGNVCIK